MPRLNRPFSKIVFFAFGIDAKTGERVGPRGSGFFLSRPSTDAPGLCHYYAVTNWHVAVQGMWSQIRVNILDGESRFIPLSPDDWHYERDGADLAIADVTDWLDVETDDVEMLPEHFLLTKDWAKFAGLELGEDVFMIGMYANVSASNRNSPAARFGSLSRPADDQAPLKAGINGAMRPAHLLDMRSRTGFSGSPVFVYRDEDCFAREAYIEGEGWIDNQMTESRKSMGPGRLHPSLLGIHCSQFNEPVEILAVESEDEALRAPIHEGDRLVIPSSMTIAVPSWDVKALLDQAHFEEIRQMRDRGRRDKGFEIPQPESAPEPTTKADNPSHKEDFNSLLTSVARGKKPAGQT